MAEWPIMPGRTNGWRRNNRPITGWRFVLVAVTVRKSVRKNVRRSVPRNVRAYVRVDVAIDIWEDFGIDFVVAARSPSLVWVVPRVTPRRVHHFRRRFGDAGGYVVLSVQQYDFDRRVALTHGLAEFFRIEIGEATVEKQHLPASFFQVNQSLGASARLFNAACAGKQAFKNSLANRTTGAGHQDMVGIVGRQ